MNIGPFTVGRTHKMRWTYLNNDEGTSLQFLGVFVTYWKVA